MHLECIITDRVKVGIKMQTSESILLLRGIYLKYKINYIIVRATYYVADI